MMTLINEQRWRFSQQWKHQLDCYFSLQLNMLTMLPLDFNVGHIGGTNVFVGDTHTMYEFENH